MTRQMPAGSQVAFAKDWLERQNIESQTIDVAAHIDPSLSYEENIKSMKRQFGLGGGRSRHEAARGLTAAECDVAIGNFEAGFNGEVARDACRCGHPDACEVKVPRKKPKATTKKKVIKTIKSQTIKRKKRSSQKTMSGKTKPQKKPKKRIKKCVRVTVKRHTRKCPTHRRIGR